jgi:DNA polymerase-3 subunit gamma/tau
VQGMLGALDQSFLIRLLDALAQKDGAGLLAVADEMATRSLSYNAALQDLGSLLHRIALAQTVPAALPDDLPERDDVLRLAALFDAEEIQLFYQIAVHGRNELGLAPDEYAGFSMTLLRMLAFRPGYGPAEGQTSAPAAAPVARPAAPVAAAPAARLSAAPQAVTNSAPARPAGLSPAMAALQAARSGGKAVRPAVVAPASVPTSASVPAENARATAPAQLPTSVPVRAPAAVEKSDGIDMPPAPPWDDEISFGSNEANDHFSGTAAQKKTEAQSEPAVRSQASTAAPAQSPTPVSAPAPQAVSSRPFELHPVPSLNWDGNWPLLAASLPVRGVAQQLAQQSELLKCAPGADSSQIQFDLLVAVDTLLAAGSVEKLTAALCEHFGQTVRVQTRVGAVEHTANAAAIADRAERQSEAEQAMQEDPFVQKLMREFGATIVPGSVKPI